MIAKIENFHKRMISSVAFSHDSRHVVTVGEEDARNIAVWDLEKLMHKYSLGKECGVPYCSQPIGNGTVVAGVLCYPDGTILTHGERQMKFWTIDSDGIDGAMEPELVGRALILGEGEIPPNWYQCACIPEDAYGDPIGLTMIGGSDGRLYLFDNVTARVVRHHGGDPDEAYGSMGYGKDVHRGGVGALCAHGDTMYSGGADGTIKAWTIEITSPGTVDTKVDLVLKDTINLGSDPAVLDGLTEAQTP